jgi:hypothetical protein
VQFLLDPTLGRINLSERHHQALHGDHCHLHAPHGHRLDLRQDIQGNAGVRLAMEIALMAFAAIGYIGSCAGGDNYEVDLLVKGDRRAPWHRLI